MQFFGLPQEYIFNTLSLFSYITVFFGSLLAFILLSISLYNHHKAKQTRQAALLGSVLAAVFGMALANVGDFYIVLWRLRAGYRIDETPGPLSGPDWFAALGHFILAIALINLAYVLGAYKSTKTLLCEED